MRSDKNKGKLKIKNKGKFIRNIFITLIAFALVIFILKIAPNYEKTDIVDKVNLIINNSNVTKSLKHDIFIEDDVIYVSKPDLDNFFDRYIYHDEENKQVITTYEEKIACISVGQNKMKLNGVETDIIGTAMLKGDIMYLPFSDMENVYNMELEHIQNGEEQIVVVSSLDREVIKADTKKKLSVKSLDKVLSRTVDKLEAVEDVVLIETYEDGWAKVRTDRGKIGYVKENQLTNIIEARQKMEKEPILNEKVNLVWDYYSEYVEAPDRTGTTIQGINVVSPSFFSLVEGGKGEIYDNASEEYINWAKENGYQVWAMFSNNSLPDTTSEILNNYSLREQMIEDIVDLAILYELDGINVDFENMYEEDKDMYSRFIIELEPRLNEYDICLSVDVTAPDGSPMWSLCFDRNVIGHVADYIIFMAYDQYGISSLEAGSTASYDWVEKNITKFLGQEGVESSKLVLGIPFYTRIWKEGEDSLDTSTVDMKNVDSVLPDDVERIWNEDSKQYYVEYEEGDYIRKMWIEDIESIKAKLSLVKQYNLAGVAFWEKDREIQEVWAIVEEALKQ